MTDPDGTETPRLTLWEVLKGQCSSERDRRNQRQVALWALIWAVTFVLATVLIEAEAVGGPVPWLLVAAPTAALLQAVRTYVRFLRETDELTRRIQHDALATAFAISVVGLLTLSLLEVAGGPQVGADALIAGPMFVWAIAQVAASLRYR